MDWRVRSTVSMIGALSLIAIGVLGMTGRLEGSIAIVASVWGAIMFVAVAIAAWDSWRAIQRERASDRC